MTSIINLYIPRIDSKFNAEFIADIFDRNGIADISRIYMEPCKPVTKNGSSEENRYNRAYIEIKSWYDTETAYNFIESIKNPNKEARIIFGHNSWWTVEINNYPNKLDSRKRVLTIFKDNNIIEDDISTTAVVDPYTYYKKTNMFKNFDTNLSGNNHKKIHYLTDKNIYNEYDREFKAKIYGYRNADQMDTVEAFDGYLHEMIKKKVL